VRPLRQIVIQHDSLGFATILPVVREGELTFGGEHYAVPFGSRVPVVAPTAGAGEDFPDNRFSAAWKLFARAAPLAEHPNQVAVLFDLETMDARIAGPPFVRALEALTARLGNSDSNGGAGAENWQFWPPLDTSSSQRSGSEPVSVATIPESREVFNWSSGTWETPADGTSRVPLVGAESWIGSVTSASRNAPAAFRLLAWLASDRGSGAGAVAIVPFRRGRADELIESALSARNYLQVPRILDVDAYLAALDLNIGHALDGELGSDEALQAAAKAWNEITDRVGRDMQRDAYRKHLNLQ
jgi:multiple sugar transport system substrate-binding protein